MGMADEVACRLAVGAEGEERGEGAIQLVAMGRGKGLV